MWKLKCAQRARRPDPLGIAGSIRRMIVLIRIVDLALAVRRERRMLLRMDDRALKDIGLSRSVACAEAWRGFWDVPVDRLSH
jgi:uncharacterized protein YjiS (DUF1127 family)